MSSNQEINAEIFKFAPQDEKVERKKPGSSEVNEALFRYVQPKEAKT